MSSLCKMLNWKYDFNLHKFGQLNNKELKDSVLIGRETNCGLATLHSGGS